LFADRLLLVGVVVAACVEFDELWSRRAADVTWMNETITKQNELMVLLTLLNERLDE
jgi:hypothetical protein